MMNRNLVTDEDWERNVYNLDQMRLYRLRKSGNGGSQMSIGISQNYPITRI